MLLDRIAVHTVVGVVCAWPPPVELLIETSGLEHSDEIVCFQIPFSPSLMKFPFVWPQIRGCSNISGPGNLNLVDFLEKRLAWAQSARSPQIPRQPIPNSHSQSAAEVCFDKKSPWIGDARVGGWLVGWVAVNVGTQCHKCHKCQKSADRQKEGSTHYTTFFCQINTSWVSLNLV